MHTHMQANTHIDVCTEIILKNQVCAWLINLIASYLATIPQSSEYLGYGPGHLATLQQQLPGTDCIRPTVERFAIIIVTMGQKRKCVEYNLSMDQNIKHLKMIFLAIVPMNCNRKYLST